MHLNFIIRKLMRFMMIWDWNLTTKRRRNLVRKNKFLKEQCDIESNESVTHEERGEILFIAETKEHKEEVGYEVELKITLRETRILRKKFNRWNTYQIKV